MSKPEVMSVMTRLDTTSTMTTAASFLDGPDHPNAGQLKASRRPPFASASGVFKDGKDHRVHVGFNKDNRKPLADNVTSRTDAMYTIKLPPGRSTCFGHPNNMRAFSLKTPGPGPIYDLSSMGFKTGPKYSFGMSNASRFGKD
jgi:hypothetical protein